MPERVGFMSRRRVSSDGLALIKRYEGFQPRAVQLNQDAWVIGYGHTKTARAGLKVSRADAEAILKEYDLAPVEQAVSRNVLAPMNDNEFDALVSFAFSIGIPAFKSSQVLAFMNSGQPLQAAMALLAWRKASINGRMIIIDALVRRRAAEAALMLAGEDLPGNAPSQLVHPQFDVTAGLEVLSDWDALENPYAEPTPQIEDQQDADPEEAPVREDEVIVHPEPVTPDPEPAPEPEAETEPDPEPEDDEDDDDPIADLDGGSAGQSETEKAAQIVSERLTRILQSESATQPEPEDEPQKTESVDEIIEAVSRLADPDALEDDINVLPQPPVIPDIDADEHPASQDPFVMVEDDPLTGKRSITDGSLLEPLPEADQEFAAAAFREHQLQQQGGMGLAKLLYLAGMIIGTLIIVLGLASVFSLLPEALTTSIRSQFNSPVVLVFVGTLLLVICGYYFRQRNDQGGSPLV